MMFQLVDGETNVGSPQMRFNIKPRFQRRRESVVIGGQDVRSVQDTNSRKYAIVLYT